MSRSCAWTAQDALLSAMERDPQTRVLVTPEDLVGFEIDGRYRLDAIVGGGGMGVVYRTMQHNLNREIAIKVLKLDDGDGKHRVERFKREIDIVAQLSHPNIVHVFDSGRDPVLGLHYIAMELIDGASLDDLMRGHRMRPELAIDIAYEVAAALTEPHKMGIVHRDIKPANVLVTTRSDDTVGVKVVDFGIARSSGSGSSSKITTTGVVVGSPMYMAPEVARGESLDGRTDLYSLGVLLYEMVTGDTPFRGSTPVAIMLRHAVEEPPSLAESVEADFRLPELVELVDGMLSKERKRRPADAKAVLRSLEKIRAAHGMTRVHIDGSKPLREALEPFLVPTEPASEPMLDADPYSATTPIGTDEMSMSADSFSGWLVSDDARAALQQTIVSGSSAQRETDDAPARGRTSTGIVLAVLALLLVIGGGVWVSTHRDARPEPSPEVVELGSQPVEAPPFVPPLAPPAPPALAAQNGAATADIGTPDAAIADAGGAEAAEVPTSASKRAKPPRTQESDRGDAKPATTDEFNKGMEWLHHK